MLEFFEAIKKLDPNNRNLAVTLLDKEFLGEKLLISGGSVIYQSKEGIPGLDDLPELAKIQDTGIFSIGGIRMFCEILGRPKKIVLCGGGHVSLPIIKIGRMTGFQIHVLEDRPKFADWARKAGAEKVTCEPFAQGLASIKGDKDTFFVVVTRGHRYDQVCLETIVEKEHAYIGMIGSRRRAALVKEALLAQGKEPEAVNRIYAPIGLNIGAETPEEIAVAVMAEIIQVKNQEKRSFGYSEEILEGILGSREPDERKGIRNAEEVSQRNAIPEGRKLNERKGIRNAEEVSQRTTIAEGREPNVLATIIMRKGSAPRKTGTKMLILPDGNCIGTIGGGCAEAEVVRIARSMIRSGKEACRHCHVDMTGEDAQEEGMVCGGVIDVLLEAIPQKSC